MNNNLQSRFPNLGSLSLALLEHVTEPIIGSKSQEILKSPIIEKELQESLGRTLIHTEQRFLKECTDEELRIAILNLPIANLQSVKDAIRAFYNHPIDSTFSDVLYARLSADYPMFPEQRIRAVISDYVTIMRQELVSFSAHIREPLNALALQNIQKNTAEIVAFLKSVQRPDMQGDMESNMKSITSLFEDYLNLVRERLNDAREKFPHDPQRNLLDFYIEPMGSTDAPPKNWEVSETFNASQTTGLWELILPSLLKGKPCILLADFGMGKSWFLEYTQYHLAMRLLSRIRSSPAWIPMRLNLRGFRSELVPSNIPSMFTMLTATSTPRSVLDQITQRAWKDAIGETQFHKFERNLLKLFEEGRFLFLLDALDEISLDTKSEMDSILTEVGGLSTRTRRSPVVLTCRRAFFRSAAEERSLIDRGFDVYYLWPWSHRQVLQYLEKVRSIKLLQQEPHQVLERIQLTHNLQDISSRAMLSAMLATQWSDLVPDEVIDLPTLYERHVERALLDWQSTKSRQIERHDLVRYMEEIAFLMFQLNSLTISPSELEEYFLDKFNQPSMKKFSVFVESISRDIKANSLLLRDGDTYAFCHISVWEFLVARKLARALGEHDEHQFQVSNRSLQYRSILNNFLIPMLHHKNQINLLSNLFTRTDR